MTSVVTSAHCPCDPRHHRPIRTDDQLVGRRAATWVRWGQRLGSLHGFVGGPSCVGLATRGGGTPLHSGQRRQHLGSPRVSASRPPTGSDAPDTGDSGCRAATPPPHKGGEKPGSTGRAGARAALEVQVVSSRALQVTMVHPPRLQRRPTLRRARAFGSGLVAPLRRGAAQRQVLDQPSRQATHLFDDGCFNLTQDRAFDVPGATGSCH
jgi:hypothetical protein